ncbi:MAG: hypothetical protein K2M60_06205 [Lachnospiraceae bacterium]|nr:hypothetical protein [Lachnospiraceae bacterium]MDE6252594.1 hypothetical protein [Lachnospiraceae bacterium]
MKVTCFICDKALSDGSLSEIREYSSLSEDEKESLETKLTQQFARTFGYIAKEKNYTTD